jgi:hypothetical protein
VAVPAAVELLDRTLGHLTACGLPPREAIERANCLAMFVTGPVLAEVGQPVGGVEEREEQFDLVRLPNVAAVPASWHSHDFDQQFELGLGSLLGGFSGRRSGTGI